VFLEIPIEELEFFATLENSIHIREDNMSGIFGDQEEVRGPGGGKEERQEQP